MAAVDAIADLGLRNQAGRGKRWGVLGKRRE